MKTFESYCKRALANCGGEAALAAKLPEVKSAEKRGQSAISPDCWHGLPHRRD